MSLTAQIQNIDNSIQFVYPIYDEETLNYYFIYSKIDDGKKFIDQIDTLKVVLSYNDLSDVRLEVDITLPTLTCILVKSELVDYKYIVQYFDQLTATSYFDVFTIERDAITLSNSYSHLTAPATYQSAGFPSFLYYKITNQLFSCSTYLDNNKIGSKIYIFDDIDNLSSNTNNDYIYYDFSEISTPISINSILIKNNILYFEHTINYFVAGGIDPDYYVNGPFGSVIPLDLTSGVYDFYPNISTFTLTTGNRRYIDVLNNEYNDNFPFVISTTYSNNLFTYDAFNGLPGPGIDPNGSFNNFTTLLQGSLQYSDNFFWSKKCIYLNTNDFTEVPYYNNISQDLELDGFSMSTITFGWSQSNTTSLFINDFIYLDPSSQAPYIWSNMYNVMNRTKHPTILSGGSILLPTISYNSNNNTYTDVSISLVNPTRPLLFDVAVDNTQILCSNIDIIDQYNGLQINTFNYTVTFDKVFMQFSYGVIDESIAPATISNTYMVIDLPSPYQNFNTDYTVFRFYPSATFSNIFIDGCISGSPSVVFCSPVTGPSASFTYINGLTGSFSSLSATTASFTYISGSTGSFSNLSVNNLSATTATFSDTITIIGIGTASQPNVYSKIIAAGTPSTIGIAIQTKGDGALTIDIPDGTATGGLNRAGGSVDLQMLRSLSSQVTSGAYSFAAGISNAATGINSMALGQGNNIGGPYTFGAGIFNTTSAEASVSIGKSNQAIRYVSANLGGELNTATGTYSTTIGGRQANSYLWGSVAHSGGAFTTTGDAQDFWIQSRSSAVLTTNGTSSLYLDGAVGATHAFIIPATTNTVWNVSVDWVSVVTQIGGTATGLSVGDTIVQTDKIGVKRIAGTSSIMGTSITNTVYDVSMSNANMSYIIGGFQSLQLTFNGASFSGGGTVSYRTLAKLSIVEVRF